MSQMKKTEALVRELGQSRADIQSHTLLMLDSFLPVSALTSVFYKQKVPSTPAKSRKSSSPLSQ